MEFKDFSRTSPKIQGLLKTLRALGSISCFSCSGVLYKTRATFCFPFRQTSAIYIFPSMPPGTCVFFLAEAGVSNAVLISLSSDDCFPPKKLSSSTAFHYKEASFTLWISRCCLVWIFSGKTQFHLNVWFKGSNIWSWRCTVNMLRLLLCKKNKIHLHSF